MNKHQKGIASILIIGLMVLVLAVVIIIGYFLLNKYEQEKNNQSIIKKTGYDTIVGKKFGELTFLGNDGDYLEFSGKVLISGTYFKGEIMDVVERNFKEKTCIELDDFSYAKIPHIDDYKKIIKIGETLEDYFDSSRLICFNDGKLSNELTSLNNSGQANLLISNYRIYQDGFSGIQFADLAEISTIKSKYIYSDMSTWEVYSNSEYNYSFKISPNYYIYKSSDTVSMAERANTWNSFLCHCGEGGSTISIDILENKENLQLGDWLNYFLENDYKDETIQSDIKEIKIDGKNGLMIDIGEMGGGTVIVVENNKLIYKIRGCFSFYPQSKDYNDFISTFKFL